MEEIVLMRRREEDGEGGKIGQDTGESKRRKT
jgi:hypothetical protein